MEIIKPHTCFCTCAAAAWDMWWMYMLGSYYEQAMDLIYMLQKYFDEHKLYLAMIRDIHDIDIKEYMFCA